MRILFTGGRAPVTLELVRNFGKNGWEVFVADSVVPNLSMFSKYAKFTFINSPRQNEQRFVDDLISIINENSIDILFPTCEEIFWISKNKEKILENCKIKILCDNIEKLSLLHNKYEFIKFAEKLKIQTPKTKLIDVGIKVNEKSVVKPIFSRFGESVTIVKKGNKLDKRYKGTHILQEFIEGENICSYGYAENGVLKFNICYKCPFQTNKASTAFVPFESEYIDKVVNRIIKKLNFSGNISFDFIRKDEKFYVIECNPRITSGIHIISDNDFTKLFFEKHDAFTKRKAQLLIPTIFTNFRFLPFRDVAFCLNDIIPFFKQLSCLNMFKKIAKKNNISLTQATTFDIEWNGEE